jgi:hypothetical protein
MKSATYLSSSKFVKKIVCHVTLAVDAVPCRIAFERGKELEELPLKQERGIVRVMAPLAGSDVCTMMA